MGTCICVQVQDDLQLLRSAVARASDGAVDMGALDSVLSRTEKGVQASLQASTHTFRAMELDIYNIML